MRVRRLLSKKNVGIFIIFCVLYIVLGLRVSNEITNDDVQAIQTLNVSDSCSSIQNFDDEISCILSVQEAVQAIGSTECASRGTDIEPLSFIERDYGCCFDRARFIEKALRYYEFQTRHLFLINPKWGISILNILPLMQGSHATSEVKTSKGWMGVDSSFPFILLDEEGNAYGYDQAMQSAEMNSVLIPRSLYDAEVDIIYGLYSRHGFFHGINLPGPEYVFDELRYNFEG